MFRNYWNVAIRNLWKNKVFSGINIVGLAVGIAGTALILLWVQYELSIDQFHIKKDRLYFAFNREVFDGKMQCWNSTPQAMAQTLKKEYPDIKEASHYSFDNIVLLGAGDKKLTVSGNFVDPGFLTMFTLSMETGDPHTALDDTYSIVITQALAKKLFGSTRVLGKSIRMDNHDNFRVTGVLQDLPLNTDFTFEYLLPYSYLRRTSQVGESWGDNGTRTVVELQPTVLLARLNKKVENITKIHSKNTEEEQVFLYPFNRMHLYSNFTDGKENGGKIDIVVLFATIAALILLIACINFMNLSTARSVLRAKGRDIDTVKFKTDTAACIFNPTGAATLGFKNPIGKLVRREGKNYTVVGIVKDFVMRSPYDKMKNLFVVGNRDAFFISFRLNPNQATTESLAKAEKIFKRFNPFFPFDYKFADEEYSHKFDGGQRTVRFSAVFAGLTIFISCLGLFGLSIFMAQNRIKEIGIRKVLGASIGSITSLLAKDFLKLVLISIVIATPFSWLAMNHWLTNFDYHMQISWWIFAYAGAVALVIAALTVSFQSVKAAVANPVKSLRSE